MGWEKFEYAKTDTTLPAMILIADEIAELLQPTDGDRKSMRVADNVAENFQSIARLGRSAHIHLILATQSSSGNLFPPSLKNNVQQRTIAGRVDGNISRMAIDTEEGESIPLSPGSYLGWTKGDTLNYQGWFTKTEKALSLGTVKPGYDPKTGMEVEGENVVDFSNLGTYQEEAEEVPMEEIDISADVAPGADENQSVDISQSPDANAVPAPEPTAGIVEQPLDTFDDAAINPVAPQQENLAAPAAVPQQTIPPATPTQDNQVNPVPAQAPAINVESTEQEKSENDALSSMIGSVTGTNNQASSTPAFNVAMGNNEQDTTAQNSDAATQPAGNEEKKNTGIGFNIIS